MSRRDIDRCTAYAATIKPFDGRDESRDVPAGDTVCVQCGQLFYGMGETTFCSQRCAAEHAKPVCRECEQPFDGLNGTIYCQQACEDSGGTWTCFDCATEYAAPVLRDKATGEPVCDSCAMSAVVARAKRGMRDSWHLTQWVAEFTGLRIDTRKTWQANLARKAVQS